MSEGLKTLQVKQILSLNKFYPFQKQRKDHGFNPIEGKHFKLWNIPKFKMFKLYALNFKA